MSNYPDMATLYTKLKDIGFDKKFVKTMLPDWWDKECETDSGAIFEGILYLSRRLNLEIDSLLGKDVSSPLKFKDTCQPKFKTQRNAKLEKLEISYSLAFRVAELVAYGCNTIYQPIESMSGKDIRKEILQDRKYIDLEGVLNFCWNRGIPVVHFQKLPKGANKFEGMVVCSDNRPVIIISLNDKSASKLLFIIFHELGHIYNKHIDSSYWIDEKILLNSVDKEEIEANEFANLILFGDPNANYYKYISSINRISGDYLANIAQNYSSQTENVSPHSIILNYSWYRYEDGKDSKGLVWSTAKAALKILEENGDAPKIINNTFKESLDWEKLSEDNQEYLELMTSNI